MCIFLFNNFNMFRNLVILLAVIITFTVVLSEDILVTIPSGTLRGRKEVSQRNATFYAFQEIPFGKPPVGKLRFKAPEPAEKWDGILDATKNTKICHQVSGGISELENEDCLYLNVYTPMNPNEAFASLPVMFFIYGGGFVVGNSIFATNGPHYFMEHDVVIVTVNYRVGPFGFLSTGDLVSPGNYGLKDQTLGLKWVQENIRCFGGDPEKVTIFGLSAGGASVTFQVMSEKVSGLFRGAIAESGSSLCTWAYQRRHKEIAYQLATYVNNSFNISATTEELFAFLQSVPASEIHLASAQFRESIGNEQLVQGFWFTPAIEPEHEDAFFTKNMFEIVATGVANKVPLMIGMTSEEQIGKAWDINNFKEVMKQYDADIKLLVNRNMHLTDPDDLTKAGEAIRKIYTDGLFENDLAGAVQYFSDVSFSVPLIHHANLQAKYSDVYFYQFSYHGRLGGYNTFVEGAGRVSHAQDDNYLWVRNNNSNLSANEPNDVLTTLRYVALHANFAKTLNPTPNPTSELLQNIKWPKVTAGKFQYLDIDTNLTIMCDPKDEHYRKWVQVYEDYAKKPYDTF